MTNPHRGERTVPGGHCVAFDFEALVAAEEATNRSSIELMIRLGSGGMGAASTIEITAVLAAGLAGYARLRDTGTDWTDAAVQELVITHGPMAFMPALFEALSEVVCGINIASDDERAEDPDAATPVDPPPASTGVNS